MLKEARTSSHKKEEPLSAHEVDNQLKRISKSLTDRQVV
jgi:hypothetical protein